MPKKSSFSYGAGFRSLTREIADPVALPVEGTLPSWLNGTLLRTGPSKFEVGARTYNHWFDGLAMLHRFAFEDGGVTYAIIDAGSSMGASTTQAQREVARGKVDRWHSRQDRR